MSYFLRIVWRRHHLCHLGLPRNAVSYVDFQRKKTTDSAPHHFRFRCFPVLFIQTDQLFGGAKTNDEDVDRKSGLIVECLKSPFVSGQIESPQRSMNEHSPTAGANQELNGNPRAMRAEFIPRLPADHRVQMAPAIELRTALPQSELVVTQDANEEGKK